MAIKWKATSNSSGLRCNTCTFGGYTLSHSHSHTYTPVCVSVYWPYLSMLTLGLLIFSRVETIGQFQHSFFRKINSVYWICLKSFRMHHVAMSRLKRALGLTGWFRSIYFRLIDLCRKCRSGVSDAFRIVSTNKNSGRIILFITRRRRRRRRWRQRRRRRNSFQLVLRLNCIVKKKKSKRSRPPFWLGRHFVFFSPLAPLLLFLKFQEKNSVGLHQCETWTLLRKLRAILYLLYLLNSRLIRRRFR